MGRYRKGIRLDVSGPQTLAPPDYWDSILRTSSEDYSDGGKFTINLPEIVGEHRTAGSLVHAVHSSTNCTMLRLDGYKYWRDYGSDNQISKGMIYQPLGWTLMVDVMKLT